MNFTISIFGGNEIDYVIEKIQITDQSETLTNDR